VLLLCSMSFSSLLNQTISLYSKIGLDKYGRETEGSATNYKARFQQVTKTRILANGETTTIDGIVFLPPTITINQGDKITYNSVDYKVFSKKLAVDGRGNTHHLTVEVQKWQI
jgi:plastocyanin